MGTKIIAVLPAGLREKALLDLSIRGRRRGENLALWEEDSEDLTILFDGETGYSLRDYTRYPFCIAPGVEMIVNPYVKSGFTWGTIAGIVMDSPHHSLSYSYQRLWGSSYLSEAKAYNKKKTLTPLDLLWRHYTSMNFAWYENAEDIEKVRNTFKGFQDIIQMNLRGLEAHIPLIEDMSELVSMN